MVKVKVSFTLLFCLVQLLALAQNKVDSSNAEIRQQAIEMREMLDKYLSDKLKNTNAKTSTPTNNDSSILEMMNRFNQKLAEHENAIKEIKEQLKTLENAGKPISNSSNTTTPLAGMNTKKLALPTEQPNDYTLIIYFDFDSFSLTQEQKKAIWQFTQNKTFKICNIHSYTDWFGTEKHNKYLALNRCDEVAKHIANKNYKIRKGKFINCGSVDPVKITKSAYCRRVEIILK